MGIRRLISWLRWTVWVFLWDPWETKSGAIFRDWSATGQFRKLKYIYFFNEFCILHRFVSRVKRLMVPSSRKSGVTRNRLGCPGCPLPRPSQG
uniref:Putative secreted protein n=1 Tax=Ixodes ricinus TaxID=34613 RepID=A0A6B0UED1_IXORI